MPLPNERQQKIFAAANAAAEISELPWRHIVEDHEILADVSGLGLSSEEWAGSPLARAFEDLGITPETRENGVLTRLRINGEENLKKLAQAGGIFPGSGEYAGRARGR